MIVLEYVNSNLMISRAILREEHLAEARLGWQKTKDLKLVVNIAIGGNPRSLDIAPRPRGTNAGVVGNAEQDFTPHDTKSCWAFLDVS
jgi:hypothetical protein